VIHDFIAADTYRDEVMSRLATGSRFTDLHGVDARTVRLTLMSSFSEFEVLDIGATNGSVPTLVDLIPAVQWDEREAHDRFGIRFDGHEPLRPLLNHEPNPTTWTVPVEGDDAYSVAVGPIHAGVIESGHFRFGVVGERILYVDTRLFYKHRGLERLAEGRTLTDGMDCIVHSCMACSVTNAVVYALACEQMLAMDSGGELARARTILLELERVWSHLNDISQVCAGVGFAAGNQFFATLTERARRLNDSLTGHRFLRGAVSIGESPLVIDENKCREAQATLNEIESEARAGWRDVVFHTGFQDRLSGVGVVDQDSAKRLGSRGPALRAAGVPEDARLNGESLRYEGFEAVVQEEAAGDVAARINQRAAELWQSLSILAGLLTPILRCEVPMTAPTATVGVATVESPRGATTCIIESDGETVKRVRLRTGSYANWSSVAHAAMGNLLPDFPLINKSFELCYACVDR
jgi:Ni,Fe-hydrogenase III large subunit